MSTTRYDRDGLTVSTFAGPPGCNPNTGGRACVQITADQPGRPRAWLMLSMDHWVDLVCFIRSMDAAGHGILSTPEVDDVEDQDHYDPPGSFASLPGVELRLVLGAGMVAGWHTPATLAALLSAREPGQWVILWPGLADEQVFYHCTSCGQAAAFPVVVQGRRA